MADPGGRPPGPEPEFRFLFGKGKNRVWEEVWNQKLAKAFLGTDSKNFEDVAFAAYATAYIP